jgi:ADP-ribose pyrophosphatase YjhB (NUDIX family)
MDFYSLLEEVQTIARNGLHYAENPYDIERYRRLLSLAEVQYNQLLEIPAQEIKQRFAAELGQITPKVGADAAIFNEQGQILLMQRVDDHKWCLPCGWVEPNEAPDVAAVRETWEETGLRVEVSELVDVFSRPASAKYGPHAMIAVVYLCRVVGGTLTLSHEGLALKYWPLEAVAAYEWHGIHRQYAMAAYQCWRNGQHSGF